MWQSHGELKYNIHTLFVGNDVLLTKFIKYRDKILYNKIYKLIQTFIII